MPGSVRNAVSSSALPVSLCRGFVHAREYLTRENQYADGERQVRVRVATSRRRWTLTKRLTFAQLEELRNFYLARGGPLEAFEFYDNYDATLYLVRFEGPWSESLSLGRHDVSISLVQVT